MGLGAEIGSSVLLFMLVFGMSATVELRQLRKQLRNRSALLVGLVLQFVVLPFCGFLVVKILNPPPAMGITLLVVTSSPGGSYSNWWCSLFNAELSLSITMTAISTLLSVVMLPANLILYTRWSYPGDVVASLDWAALFIGLVVVIGGIAGGLITSTWIKVNDHLSTANFHRRANLLGNVAGIALITLSVTVSSTGQDSAVWDQNWTFYVGVALPFLLGLTVAVLLTSRLDLEKPERVAVAVEASFQNTGIATSVAITMFATNEEALAMALGVPLYYGLVEAVGLAIFCTICWKLGWTKAPANENFCVMVYKSYEVEEQENDEQEIAIEVVLGSLDGGGDDGNGSGNKESSPNDLIFEHSDDGDYVVDEASLHKAQNRNKNGADPLNDTTDTDSPTLSTLDDSDEHDTAGGAAGSEEQQQRGLSRTIAVIKARATGYRQPPPQQQAERSYRQDPRILSALDDSEDLAGPQVPHPPEATPDDHDDDDANAKRPSSRYQQIPVTAATPSPEKNAISLPAEGKQID